MSCISFIRLLPAALLCLLTACGGASAQDNAPASNAAAFAVLHERSEAIYDGDGSWGQSAYGYRMALRDSYWRSEVYLELAATSPAPLAATYALRGSQAVQYLLRAQAAAGTGVFGFPADTGNPEFGSRVQKVLDTCPACAREGWIASLPGADMAELYYDHGYALSAVAHAYEKNHDAALLGAIRRAADWTLDKPLTRNVNYLSALSKGLCGAYRATGDRRYLDRAIALHRDGVLPFISEQGEARDEHNARLEYHGFIVSGLVALRASLPAEGIDTAFRHELDRKLALAVGRMAERGLSESGSYGATWPGTNLLAWYELSKYRPLTGAEIGARDRALALVRGHVSKVSAEQNAFRLRKSLYSDFFIGLFGAAPPSPSPNLSRSAPRTPAAG